MEEVVEYKYDTWGNVIGMEGSDYGKWVGSLNPFRYSFAYSTISSSSSKV